MTAAISSPLLGSTGSVADTAAGASANGGADKIKGVAKQFEAVFLRQMLAAARSTKFGDSLFSDSQAMDTFKQMQDERFADIASDTGAFGLGKMIQAHLARFVQSEAGSAGGNSAGATAGTTTTDTAAKEATGNGI